MRCWNSGWRVRASPSRPFEQLANSRIVSDFGALPSSPNQLRWNPLPMPSGPTDLIEGMVTMAGNGDAATQSGAAAHLYAVNRSMMKRSFYNADGEMQMTDDGPMGWGWLRASHRELDEKKSRPEQPYHTHANRQWLVHGVPVPLDVEVWPNSVLFEAGESLQVIIKGTPIRRYGGPFEMVFHPLHNVGPHAIHTGGEYDSFLYMPVIERT